MDKITVEERYMKVTKMCSLLTGIWPDQSKFSQLVARTIIYVICVSSLFTQIEKEIFKMAAVNIDVSYDDLTTVVIAHSINLILITMLLIVWMAQLVCFFSLNAMIEQICFLFVVSGVLIKQGNYIINATKYKMLLNTIWEDWSKDRAKDELEIMVGYAERTAFFCRTYFGVGMVCSGCFVQQALSPIVLDIILPANETRDVLYIYPAYYLIDDRKYRSFIIFHLSYAMFVTYHVFVSCDTSFVCVVQHACGQIAVAGHRFRNAISDLSVAKQLNDIQDENYEAVRHSIQAHQHAINYLKIIENCHVTYLCICVAFVMGAFSVTLLKVASYDEISAPLIKDGVFLASQLIHILFLTLQGQFVLNSNNEIAESIYDASWYNSNKETQLLFALALRNCLSPPILSAGGLLTLNLETFAQIIKGSVSYFTVLKSS